MCWILRQSFIQKHGSEVIDCLSARVWYEMKNKKVFLLCGSCPSASFWLGWAHLRTDDFWFANANLTGDRLRLGRPSKRLVSYHIPVLCIHHKQSIITLHFERNFIEINHVQHSATEQPNLIAIMNQQKITAKLPRPTNQVNKQRKIYKSASIMSEVVNWPVDGLNILPSKQICEWID